MTDLVAYGYMQRALLAAVLIGGVCAVIGVYVVLRGLAFIGAGIAHASFGGVAIGAALGVNPVGAAIVFCLLVAWAIGYSSKKSGVKEDTAVGIFFAVTMALGVLIVGLMEGYRVDLMSYLFGSIISVTWQDLWMTVSVAAVIAILVAVFYKDLLFIVFDPEAAIVAGLPVELLYYLLLSMMALVIVTAIKVVGIVLVSALVVIPAAAALQLTERFNRAMLASAAIGVSSCVVGLFAADWLGVSPGAAIVLLEAAVFGVTAAVSPVRRRAL
ncbi:MAG: metal ABC transporter permease [Armatimonadota bacterium]|nr:metal ABC transporter permease [Armatimonadota bacterium]